jgi:hypothetical protein
MEDALAIEGLHLLGDPGRRRRDECADLGRRRRASGPSTFHAFDDAHFFAGLSGMTSVSHAFQPSGRLLAANS